ncbi:MAG TPA: sugar kinase [Actinomycetota bacterium]|nr:sugar kinase [Actinomycetota bacterium]
MTPVPDVIALGETMRSIITVPGPTGERSAPFVTHGGAESNACVALVRLGVGAAWVSRLGTDAAGDLVMEELRAHGVDLRWVRRDPERPTGSMFRETTGGPPVYERAGSAASALEPEDLDGVPVEHVSAVLVTGITAMLGEGPQRAAIALLERARGLRVVDPNLRRGLWGSDRAGELIRPLVERADVLIGGEAELAELLGGPRGRAVAERCRDLGPREVVLKRGADGAAALTTVWVEHRPPPRRDLDPVGAGDAFNAGYLAARLSGGSVEDALEQGARCGAEVASTIGDTGPPGRPTPDERENERRSP